MRTLRCYIDAPLTPGHTVNCPDDVRHHLCAVLRQRDGAEVDAFNGDGQRYRCTLRGDRKALQLEVTASRPGPAPSPLKVHLYQAIGKGDHMDFALQKATELGVHRITPVVTAYSETHRSAERREKKWAHWQAVIRSAAVQSERCELPTLHPIADIQQLPEQGLLLHPGAATRLVDHPLEDSVNILIGPEGGLADTDIDTLPQWQRCRLGPRILRTETATTAALTALQLAAGDL